jgi:hypothetical protein
VILRYSNVERYYREGDEKKEEQKERLLIPSPLSFPLSLLPAWHARFHRLAVKAAIPLRNENVHARASSPNPRRAK